MLDEVPDLAGEEALLPFLVVEVRVDDVEAEDTSVGGEDWLFEHFDKSLPLHGRQTHAADARSDAGFATGDHAQPIADGVDRRLTQLQEAAAGAVIPQHRGGIGAGVDLREQRLTDELEIEAQRDGDVAGCRLRWCGKGE